jgi:hypothetical protein
LHLTFFAASTLLFFRTLTERPQNPRAWMLFGYVVGLSFSHHMMTVLLLPAFGFCYFARTGFGIRAWKPIACAVPAFLAGLTSYLYLPLRAATSPAMNWGDPTGASELLAHVSGAAFRHRMFTSIDSPIRKLGELFSGFPFEFTWGPLLLAVVGLWASLRNRHGFAWFFPLVFVTAVFYSINYDYRSSDYFLHAWVAASFWIACGTIWLVRKARGAWRVPTAVGCAALAAMPLVFNYRLADRSRDHAVEDFARNVLESAAPGATVFSNEYWLINSPADYLQQVEGFRADVAILDIGLFGFPWFYHQLESRHPEIVRESRPTIEAYRVALEASAEGAFDTSAYNARLADMFLDLVASARARGPVYVTAGINPSLLEDYLLVPSGLLFRVESPSDTMPPPAVRDFAYRPLPSGDANPMGPVIRDSYAEGLANQGAYRVALGDTAEGVRLLKNALALQPDFPPARELLRPLMRSR